jgi:hypothetical protein
MQKQEKDAPILQAYGTTQVNPLDYARFEHLMELVSAQWQIFREIFDFGNPSQNKQIFYDKMMQIAKVRNMLAHSRDLHENELLRARVLCTDILLALDRWGGEER